MFRNLYIFTSDQCPYFHLTPWQSPSHGASAGGRSSSSQYWSGSGMSGWLGMTLMQAWVTLTTPDWPQREAEQEERATARQVRLQCMLQAFTRERGRGRYEQYFSST